MEILINLSESHWFHMLQRSRNFIMRCQYQLAIDFSIYADQCYYLYNEYLHIYPVKKHAEERRYS